MENQKIFKTPKKTLARMQVVHLGKILFNLQIVMALIVASPLPFIIYPMYYAALILISFFTGFILFVDPRFVSLWDPTRIYAIMNPLVSGWAYTVPIVIGLSLLSILCLYFDKNNRHLKRMITSIVIIVIVLIYLIFRISIIN